MKVYAIIYDPKSLSHLENDCDEDTMLRFTRSFYKKRDKTYRELWQPPPFYHCNAYPIDVTFFYSSHIASFTFYSKLLADKSMMELFVNSGEILPIMLSESKEIAHVFHCMNRVGSEKEILEYIPDSIQLNRDRIIMKKSMIPDRGIFWLSPLETFLYTIENEKLGIEHNFKMLYDARGYTGLDFVEVKLI